MTAQIFGACVRTTIEQYIHQETLYNGNEYSGSIYILLVSVEWVIEKTCRVDMKMNQSMTYRWMRENWTKKDRVKKTLAKK